MDEHPEFDDDFKKYAINLVKEIYKTQYAPKQTPGQAVEQHLPTSNVNPILLYQSTRRRIDPSTDHSSEIEQFLTEPAPEIPIESLIWWKINAARLPHLAMMARDYLAVPG
jgi:hypothetical protein